MSLGSDLTAALPELRAQAESMMITECVVKRANGTTSRNESTLIETPNYDTIYTGICRVKGASGIPAVGAIPGAVAVTQSAELHFPVSTSGGIRTNDIWECTKNDFDPAMVGGTVRIAGAHQATLATARRFPIASNS